MTSGQTAPDPASLAQDPPPYAYLDDPGRAAGRMTPGVTIGYGGFFLAAAAVFLVILLVTADGSFGWAGLFPVVLFGAIGGFILHMGLARRAWRQRHPGVDPLTAVSHRPTGGSAYGPDTTFARVLRIVLLVVCWGFAAVGLFSLPRLFMNRDPSLGTGSFVASVVILAGLVVLFAVVGWFDLRRILAVRRGRGSADF